jgi:GH43 family beta-xylosidase
MRTLHCLIAAVALAFAVTRQAAAVAAQPGRVAFVGEPGATSIAAEFADAFEQLPEGGTIVLRGTVRLGREFLAPAHAARVTITSVHDGKDYRADGAKLVLGAEFFPGGPATFEGLVLEADAKTPGIFCAGHPVVLGNDIACKPAQGGKFPAITGAADGGGSSDVTVNSGEWESLSGGAPQDTAPTGGSLRVTINGGRFNGPVCAAGAGRHTGNAALTVNGGEFFAGVAVLANHPGASFNGDATVTINNGVFFNTIAASRNAGAEFAGSYALAINGGDFTSVTDVTGTRDLRGVAASTLTAPPWLLDKRNAGALTFTNPLIPGADPWVFFDDGFYYATATGGSQLSIRKVANLPDLPRAASHVIYKPAPGNPWSRNLWSPKIYHFSEAEVGAENAGWYLYLSANDGSGRPAQGQRMFVLRSLSGTPLGPYGEVNGNRTPHVATRVTAAAKGSDFNEEWCGGAKILKHDGKLYAIWVSEVGNAQSVHTGDRYQIICIDRLINPWTIAGNPVVINRPTLAWEKHGAGPGKAGMYPEVVEGGTPVHSADGTLYLLYAGSGYWTPHYAIGVMKLTGTDPMNPSHWQKALHPIFKASDEVVGTGNACYVPSPTGKTHWAIYHAYVGKKTRGVPRQLFAEPYLATAQGVVIGRGTPLPLGTPLKIEANPMPLRQKISGFTDALPSPDSALPP